MQTLMIKELKKNVSDEHQIVIFDAPPGTSCPVVETVADADYIILVTEPTPFGLHDLKLTITLLRDIGKEFGVIVNKSGLGNSDVFNYLNDEKIELLGEIPFDKDYAKKYADGSILKNISADIESRYHTIVDKIALRVKAYEGDNNS